METKQGNVLYINFEVSEKSLQDRLNDSCEELQLEMPEELLVHTIPGGLSLESVDGYTELKNLVEEAESRMGSLDLVIIDPRRQSMGGDENQSEILNNWCGHLNEIQQDHSFATVIVHHTGKSTKGAGRGSSVFDAWLDTMLWIEPPTNNGRLWLERTSLRIQGRDTDQRSEKR